MAVSMVYIRGKNYLRELFPTFSAAGRRPAPSVKEMDRAESRLEPASMWVSLNAKKQMCAGENALAAHLFCAARQMQGAVL